MSEAINEIMKLAEGELSESELALLAQMYNPDNASSFNDELDILDIIPRIKLSKTSSSMQIIIQENDYASEIEGRQIYGVIVETLASKGLWLRGSDQKFPVCSANDSVLNIRKSECSGSWNHITGFQTPHNLAYELADGDIQTFPCRGCRWNEFGSASRWDPTKSSKAKACQDSRTFIVMLMKYNRPHPLYHDKGLYVPLKQFSTPNNPYGLCIISLSYGTNRQAIKKIAGIPSEYGVATNVSVLNFQSLIEKGNGFTYGTLKAEFKGIIHPHYMPDAVVLQKTVDNIKSELRRAPAITSPALDDTEAVEAF